MKKLYVVPKSVALEFADRFSPKTGAHWIDLPNDMLLMATDFEREHHEEAFLDHPEVGILPDPIFEGTKTMADVKKEMKALKAGDTGKNMQQKHFDALTSIGVDDTHTVVDIAKKAKAIHPLVKCKYLR